MEVSFQIIFKGDDILSIYTDFLHDVRCGKRYKISLKDKTIKVNGKELLLIDNLIDKYDTVKIGLEKEISDFWSTVENLYAKYKRSVPSAKKLGNESHFHSDKVEDLTDDELAFNESRCYMQAALEAYVLLSSLNGDVVWQNANHWFWQGTDRNLIILREWI